MRQKVEYIIKPLKENYIFFFAYLPVAMAEYNLHMVVSEQRSLGNVDETLLLVLYLVATTQFILLEYSLVKELKIDKIGKYISAGIRLLAGYSFLKAMLVLFS